MRSFLLGLSLFATLALTVHPQDHAPAQSGRATIEVGSTKLRLGMTKAQVEEKLSGHDITKIQPNEWMVSSEKELGPTLQFSNGQLTFADRYWTTSDNDIGEAFFGAATTLNQEGFSACTLESGTKVSPDMTAHNVWINCGEKSILVTRHLMGGKSYNMVYEQLGVMQPWDRKS
jgi:hypothetical protein